MNLSNFRDTFLKALLVSLVLAYAPFAGAQEPHKDIRLVLQLTVDGLRADLLNPDIDYYL